MDCTSISFEPNLKFVLELKEDLRNKYYEQYEKAKDTLENFSCCLQDVFHKHQKLLAEKIELTIINEKLIQILNKHESDHQKISSLIDNQSSQILRSSTDCILEIPNKMIDSNENTPNKINNKNLITEKENVSVNALLFSSDCSSDNENASFQKFNSSPPPSVIQATEKVQNSPILCKRKSLKLKKNNLLMSTSTKSNTDNKRNLSNSTNAIENLNENEIKYYKEHERENNNNKPLKTTENNFKSTENIQDKNSCHTILSVSKTEFGKTEFVGNGKRLRQTKLSLKKMTPIIDISKVDCNENFNKDKCKIDDSCKDNFLNNEFIGENVNTSDETHHKNITFNALDIKRESFQFKQISANQFTKKITENQNKSLKDDELIEISPRQNEKSKLRNKLNLNNKIVKNKTAKSSSILKNDKITNFENNTKNNLTHKNDFKSTEKVSKSCLKQHNLENNYIATEKNRTFEHQKTINDETYFSPAELSHNKMDVSDFSIDSSKFEDEVKCGTPPAKKVLLNSFDIIPGRTIKSPDYAFKEAPIRKKNEKAKLPGWCCRDCENWYKHLPEEEKIKRKNECSKHRGKYKADILTPESFWNPVFEDINDSTAFGHY